MADKDNEPTTTENTVSDDVTADTIVQAATVNVTVPWGFANGPGAVIHGGQHIHRHDN
ncbi:hypothetical protein [Streptomyces sp. NRRL F-2890]|uniref:hypothetical protein n=1 Tax=Streptomyces sp. NRRL F-2890 TaxID=1463845 RepID=UPI000A908472|nr:hypothetical protein [Streptomyces sp. NRRL F-2890]